MLDVQNNNEIRSYSCPNCYLCGTSGNLLYQGLKDRLFGVSGEWDLKRCPNPECGLVWLDPMPLEEDLEKAYQAYYTHGTENIKKNIVKRLFRRMFILVTKDIPSYLLGIKPEEKQHESMYLAELDPGKLLDVGCGSGRFLNHMQQKGWEVEGIDFDDKAVEYARTKYGVNIHIGNLENVRYEDNTFDAITMHHVIEHISDPVELLQECYRILKPGGTLVAVTPNINSWGHEKFGADWRGLEPPRHIYLFGLNTLRECANKAEFYKVNTWTTTAHSISTISANLYLKKNGYLPKSKINIVIFFNALILRYYLFFLNKKENSVGEYVVLKASKV